MQHARAESQKEPENEAIWKILRKAIVQPKIFSDDLIAHDYDSVDTSPDDRPFLRAKRLLAPGCIDVCIRFAPCSKPLDSILRRCFLPNTNRPKVTWFNEDGNDQPASRLPLLPFF